MAVEGSLDLFQLPEILQIISQEQKTGILTVQGNQDIVAISFLDGRVVAADALNQTLEDGLGQVLLDRNLLSQESYDQAQAQKRETQGRLIDVLVEAEMLERSEVLDALRLLTLDLLGELLDWREGEFKFYGGDEVSYEEGFRPIAIEDLLLANLPQATEKPAAAETAETEGDPLEDGGFLDFDEPPKSEEGEIYPPSFEPTFPSASSEPEPASPEPQSPETAARERPPDLSEPDLPDVSLRPPEAPSPVASPVASSVADAGLPPTLPAELEAEPRAERRARRRAKRKVAGDGLRQPLSWMLGLAAATLLIVVLVTFPAHFLLPTSAEHRAELEESRRNAAYAKIERAVRSYALIDTRLPEQLEELTQLHMLSPEEVRGPLGQPLLYEVKGLVYTLRPLLTEEDAAFTGSLLGDFLRDPALVTDRETGLEAPLELLD